MAHDTRAFLLTLLLAAFSVLIGLSLYRYGSAHVEHRSVRVGGAVAVAGLAFYMMTWFYFRQLAVTHTDSDGAKKVLQRAIEDYDLCLAQEKTFACQQPADSVRSACKELLAR